MSLLTVLPLSKNKLALLTEIYLAQEDYLRNLEKKTHLNPSLLHRLLANLSKAGVLSKQKKGREIYYSLSSEQHDFWEKMIETYRREIVLEKYADLKVLFKLLLSNNRIFKNSLQIYLFGSFAAGEINKDSDLDLLFITRQKKAILEWCREVSVVLNREINPLIYTPARFQKELARKETLLTSIINKVRNRIILKARWETID